LGLHLFFASLIIVECSLNVTASSNQSTWLAEVVRSIANWINQSPTVKTITPNAFSVTPDERISGTNGLVLGKTKLLSYTLGYESSSNVVYNSSITYERKDGSSASDYQVLLSSSTKGGAFRIVPYKTGTFEVDFLTAASGPHYDYAFEVKNRLAPTSFTYDTSGATLKINETLNLGPTLTSDLKFDLGAETLDHYLQRFYDPNLIEWVSSDPAVVGVSSYGIIQGKSAGTATISPKLFPTLTKTITVSSDALALPSNITLSLSQANVHPGDFSYWTGSERYGVQVTASLDDGSGVTTGLDQGVHFISSDPLVAMVSNDHLDSDGTLISGGFIQGYDLKGTAEITAISNANPALTATVQVTSADETATAFEWHFSLNGTSQTLTPSYSVTAGDSFGIKADFLPKNTTDQSLNVVSLDPNVIAVYSNNTSAPSLGFLKAGSADVTITSNSNPSFTVTISFSVAAAPYIPASDVQPLSYVVRKIGHFVCYGLSALFLLLFLFSGFRHDKGFYWLSVGTSLTEGFLLACLGEFIQRFVPKRTASWRDIGIDFAGVTLGVLIIGILYFIRDHKKKKAPVEPSQPSKD
jgi:VanZ family protein